ncbi:putative nuclease HARBI1 [Cinnamomum micranthum f. kanehirae]|uniref:Putative nuclease HARBI1 n=1 Tax=Cinnamomum micranthum f. kanehirae TaxID=337451 RepID=A0A3S3MPR1_9MAGN|nr:putative nuclease HARBI1 [Cinnamomum micranthum f. kanehirae]
MQLESLVCHLFKRRWLKFFGDESLRPSNNNDISRLLAQESSKKDVVRAFGVLQAHFAIVHGPTHFWDHKMLKDIMKGCTHNC